MEPQIDISPTLVPPPSVVREGWFIRTEQTLGLISSGRRSIVERIALLIAIGWIPLLLLTALFNPASLHSFLVDGRSQLRMLIAIPALLVGELFIAYQMDEAASYLRQGGLLDDVDMSYIDNLIVSIRRRANALIPQLVVFVLVIIRIIYAYHSLSDRESWLGQETVAGFHLSAAGWYAMLVSAPLWVFLLGMTMWSWVLWIYFVFQLSRRKLNLVASHPDKQGGLAFLGLSASGFAPVAFALTLSIAATWHYAIVCKGAHLMDFKFHAIVLSVCIAVISTGPLLFFVPRLIQLRRSGILDYGVLGQLHSTKYHAAWVLQRSQQDTKTLFLPENNTLLNFGKTYDNVGATLIFPATIKSLYPVAVAVIIPGIYVASAQLPIVVILKDLMHALH